MFFIHWLAKGPFQDVSFFCMIKKPYKGWLHLVLRLRFTFILTNLEVTKLVGLLVTYNHMKPIKKIVLFKVILGKILQIPFLWNDHDFILDACSVNDIPKFSIHFNLFLQKLLKISRIKNSSSTGWVRSKLNFQVDFLGFLSFFGAILKVCCSIRARLYSDYTCHCLLTTSNDSICSVSNYVGEGSGTPLQYSCLENPMDRVAWWAAVHVVAKSRTRLSDFTFTFHFPALEKEMATHCSVLAWRIPGNGEPGGLTSVGSHRVGHDWSDLAASNYVT